MKLTIVFSVFLLFSFFYADAQKAAADTTSSAASAVIWAYKKERGDQLLLYNGIEYAHSYPHTVGNPFLVSDTFSTGSLVYDGVAYQDVPLNYNIESGSVVIKNKDNFLIELIPEKLNSFILNQRIFVSLSPADVPADVMQPGIYEWHDNNSAGVFISHRKIVTRTFNATDPDLFKEYTEIFIQKGAGVSRIKSNKDLLTVFADQKNAVNSYLRQNGLNFKEKSEETAIKATAYYAQLKTR